ncbi:MAG: DUF3412 domain-containing protein [Gammaproteobacteria bacterium]|nr:DUF3412 domain-containing protein [Gammaproteobacteria bacterium]MBI5615256.1 DUF3412 domain-containing protein [Gammaproteobacteria bacterium]
MRIEKRTLKSVAVNPVASLAVLAQAEVNDLCAARDGKLFDLIRRCALAVMTSGSYTDNPRELLAAFADFDIAFEHVERGIRIHLSNAPAVAFVDGEMILGVQEHLSSVLRDLVYVTREIEASGRFDPTSPAGITDIVFHILRNANLLVPGHQAGLVVCWGGHAIERHEYDYTKEVGYQLGLRGLDVCTGCGPGAMKGPMKGATIAHAKQRIAKGRYIGITEPGIIAAEAPNPIVNNLVIMPDIEKRLEGFVRLGHGIIIFPGGVGTAEEFLYLLGILAHPDNAEIPLPLILTGPASSEPYFRQLDAFIQEVFGEQFARRYRIVVDDPAHVAAMMRRDTAEVLAFRDGNDDAAYFNWLLRIGEEFQKPFVPTHESMAKLELSRDQPPYVLAGNLRRMFSGLVCGNVKEDGIRAVEAHGPFEVRGEIALMRGIDHLLQSFIAQGRMRLNGREYQPCYRLVK